jgi:hypothetical protein
MIDERRGETGAGAAANVTISRVPVSFGTFSIAPSLGWFWLPAGGLLESFLENQNKCIHLSCCFSIFRDLLKLAAGKRDKKSKKNTDKNALTQPSVTEFHNHA